MSRITAMVCALVALGWLTTPAAYAQEKLEKVYGGVAGLSGALAHAFIPKDSGLYQKYGLDVELIFFQRTTKQSLAKRLKINDKEILDAAYVAYKKLTEKKPHPTMKGIGVSDRRRGQAAKSARPEEFVNLALLKELDQSGFIDQLYKK